MPRQLSGKLLFCNRRCEPTCPTLCVSVPFHVSAHSGQSKPDSVSAALGIPSIVLIVLHVPSWEVDSRYFFCGGFRMAANIKMSQVLPKKRLFLRGQSLSLMCVLRRTPQSGSSGSWQTVSGVMFSFSLWTARQTPRGFAQLLMQDFRLSEPEGAIALSDHHVIVTDCWMCGGTVLAMRSIGPCSVAPEQPPTRGRLRHSS